MNRYIKKGELQDALIVSALRKAADMYENGEIIETHDMLVDIVNALSEFERREEEENA